MPLTGTASAWATAIMANINQAGLEQSEKDAIKAAWENLAGVHITHLTSNSLISTTGTTGTGSPGGPLPITAQPGTLS